MKRFLPLLLLLLAACGQKEKLVTDPASFEIKVTDVAGTKVWFSITTDNPNAYYTFGEVGEDSDAYQQSPAQVAADQLYWMDEIYKEFSPYATNWGTFADMFLYQGSREFKDMYLERDMAYKLFVMQVNPDTHAIIGTPTAVPFHTTSVAQSDLSFEVNFYADALEIIPSDNSQAYYWDYDNTEVIENEYGTPELYFYQLVDLYEEYAFMGNLVDQGPCEWVFSVEDKSMNEGEPCTLVIGGYADGEVNTDLLIIEFIYHKDKPCEVTGQRTLPF